MSRQTPQRVAIEQVLLAAGRPLGPQEICDLAQQQVSSLNLATVYRTLKRMVEEKQIAMVELPGDSPRYEIQSGEEEHHHHFRCRHCNAVYDLNKGCVKGLGALLPKGFSMSGHDLVLYGTCESCGRVG